MKQTNKQTNKRTYKQTNERNGQKDFCQSRKQNKFWQPKKIGNKICIIKIAWVPSSVCTYEKWIPKKWKRMTNIDINHQACMECLYSS